MKALVMRQPVEFEYADWPIPEITDTQVLVRVRAVSICGSDVEGSRGKNGRRIPPIIMGHEASGEIVQVGPAVQGWQIGQRVTFDSTEYCGHCRFCRGGLVNLCDNRKVLGVSCDEYRRHGAMAEYVAIESRTLYALPDSVSYAEAALVEPFSVGVHATAISPLKMGDTVLINGCGTIGLMTLQAARAAGAARILAADRNETRRAIALASGATEVIDSSADNIPAQLLERTNGRGVDVAFDAVGVNKTINDSIYSLRKGGCAVSIGNITTEVNFPLQYCIVHQIRVQSSYASCGEYDICLAMIAQKKVTLDPFLKAIMPLSEGKEAFARLLSKEPGLQKIILTNE